MVSSPPGAGETLLAITYNGKNVALTVTELTGGSTQEVRPSLISESV